jgi:hypothetical protein
LLRCPYCDGPISHSELFSARLLRPRTCRSCGGLYFEGGAPVGFGIVAAGCAIATSLRGNADFPEWASLAAAFGSAALAVWWMHRCQPRKIDELRSTALFSLAVVPVVALATWALLAVTSR